MIHTIIYISDIHFQKPSHFQNFPPKFLVMYVYMYDSNINLKDQCNGVCMHVSVIVCTN